MLAIYRDHPSSTSGKLSLSSVCYWKIPMEDSEVLDRSNTNSTSGWRFKNIWNWRCEDIFTCRKIKIILAILTPFALSPLALSNYAESRCGFVILWVTLFWVLEPVSISVTALLPIPLMPLLGILSSKDVAVNYMQEALLMFLGSLGIAIAVEHSNLHKRIALKVLLTVGSESKWLLFNFMFITMFVSMWISNAATTAMMVPIITAVMEELEIKREIDETIKDKELLNLHKTLLLSIAYSANCGGTGTITGTPANMIFMGFMETFYPENYEITYSSWMAYSTPGMILCVLSAWIVLQALYIPWWSKSDKKTRKRIAEVIESRYEELGGITFHEAAVLSLFIFLVLLWIFREPRFIRGWTDLLPPEKASGDSVPAIGVLILMFLLPAEPWKLHNSPPLLTWKIMQQKMPWGILILLGGGYALADGAQSSRLSIWIGEKMSGLCYLPAYANLVIMCAVTVFVTEIMSNAATTSFFLPIVNQMAVWNKVNPIYLMLPVTISASFAFMMPVASGPNAIVFGTNILRIPDMFMAGYIMKIIAVLLQMLMIHTFGTFWFHLNTFPQWAKKNTSFPSTFDVPPELALNLSDNF